MKSGFLLLGIVVIVLVLSGCISSYDRGVSGAETQGPMPVFTAVKSNNTTVMILLLDLNGATNVTGLHVESPSIGAPDVIANNTAVPVGREIKVTDPKLAGKVHLVITASVNGTSRVVLNGTV